MSRARRPLILLAGGLSVLVAASLTGCRAPAIAAENDRLRSRVLELERHNESLTRRNAELAAELQRLAAAPDTPAADVLSAVPHPVELGIGRLSHARDAAGDGLPDEIVIYLRPLDGLGRFVQVTGEVDVSAAVVPADGPPVALGGAHFDPLTLREAYRSGIGGTHYTLTVPISLPAEADVEWIADRRAIVSVTFTEAGTGRALTAERPIALRRSREDVTPQRSRRPVSGLAPAGE